MTGFWKKTGTTAFRCIEVSLLQVTRDVDAQYCSECQKSTADLFLSPPTKAHPAPGPGRFWNVHQRREVHREIAQSHAFDGRAF